MNTGRANMARDIHRARMGFNTNTATSGSRSSLAILLLCLGGAPLLTSAFQTAPYPSFSKGSVSTANNVVSHGRNPHTHVLQAEAEDSSNVDNAEGGASSGGLVRRKRVKVPLPILVSLDDIKSSIVESVDVVEFGDTVVTAGSILLEDVLPDDNDDNPFVLSCLSHFGDYNAWELTQQYITAIDEGMIGSKSPIVLVGIGSTKAARKFADDLNLDEYSDVITLVADETGEISKKLGCYQGWLTLDDEHATRWKQAQINPYIRLFGMIFGFGSPGTIPAVLYGYFGDFLNKNGMFGRHWVVSALLQGSGKGRFPSFTQEAFTDIDPESSLRPFELATLRLQTGLHIAAYWRKLGPRNGDLFTQMGGTFVYQGADCLWHHFDGGILTYANVTAVCEAVGRVVGMPTPRARSFLSAAVVEEEPSDVDDEDPIASNPFTPDAMERAQQAVEEARKAAAAEQAKKDALKDEPKDEPAQTEDKEEEKGAPFFFGSASIEEDQVVIEEVPVVETLPTQTPPVAAVSIVSKKLAEEKQRNLLISRLELESALRTKVKAAEEEETEQSMPPSDSPETTPTKTEATPAETVSAESKKLAEEKQRNLLIARLELESALRKMSKPEAKQAPIPPSASSEMPSDDISSSNAEESTDPDVDLYGNIAAVQKRKASRENKGFGPRKQRDTKSKKGFGK